jgi:signal transduction histidine kinase
MWRGIRGRVRPGCGCASRDTPKAGIGLVAMRERAELLGGSLEFRQPPAGGTLVRLRVPREKAELHAE